MSQNELGNEILKDLQHKAVGAMVVIHLVEPA